MEMKSDRCVPRQLTTFLTPNPTLTPNSDYPVLEPWYYGVIEITHNRWAYSMVRFNLTRDIGNADDGTSVCVGDIRIKSAVCSFFPSIQPRY
jgi:hypothetical protein